MGLDGVWGLVDGIDRIREVVASGVCSSEIGRPAAIRRSAKVGTSVHVSRGGDRWTSGRRRPRSIDPDPIEDRLRVRRNDHSPPEARRLFRVGDVLRIEGIDDRGWETDRQDKNRHRDCEDAQAIPEQSEGRGE